MAKIATLLPPWEDPIVLQERLPRLEPAQTPPSTSGPPGLGWRSRLARKAATCQALLEFLAFQPRSPWSGHADLDDEADAVARDLRREDDYLTLEDVVALCAHLLEIHPEGADGPCPPGVACLLSQLDDAEERFFAQLGEGTRWGRA